MGVRRKWGRVNIDPVHPPSPAPVTEKAAAMAWFLLFRRLLLLIGPNGGRCGMEWHSAEEKPISAIDGL